MKPKTAHKLKPGATLMFKGYNESHTSDSNYKEPFDTGDLLLFINRDPESDNLVVIRIRDKVIAGVFPEEVRQV